MVRGMSGRRHTKQSRAKDVRMDGGSLNNSTQVIILLQFKTYCYTVI